MARFASADDQPREAMSWIGRWQTESIGETGQRVESPTPQQAWDNRAPTVPMRVGWLQPDDISPVAVFLASDAANLVRAPNTR